MVRDAAASAALAAAALLLGAGRVAAQEVTDTAAPVAQGYVAPVPEAATADLAGSGLSAFAGGVVLPARSAAEVDQANRVAARTLEKADADLALTTDRRAKANAQVQARQSRLAELEVKRKQADKEKNKSEKAALDAQKRALEKQKFLAEEIRSLNDAEVEAARKARDVAVARQQALDLERQLVEKRSGNGSPAVINELERQTLVAQKKAASLDRELAGKQDYLAGKRLDVFKEYLGAK
jgi:colicin import membrane protein